MLWPALRALSIGELTADQLSWLRRTFALADSPRSEGPGAAGSLAHRTFTDDAGVRLVLDVARTGPDGWVFTLFRDGSQPSQTTVETFRGLFRQAIEYLGLTLVEITPAAAADEVHVPESANGPEDAFGAHWALPQELSRVWPHLGLREDAPAPVRAAKLRELMGTEAWSSAPADLRHQADAFLRAS
ncbi:hypothetical protein [Streptomyces sp. VB1]|uniref:hypothetical protein n=1 Tax=Streptomyces sp. VB1 TaxID=2986803 RepID=UPI0022426868|nr:hypothetical protein [Streptomyces sp. VB1]UZI34047.1 hypothetical protein OH133_38655 [Streptomyces sp. VB1]